MSMLALDREVLALLARRAGWGPVYLTGPADASASALMKRGYARRVTYGVATGGYWEITDDGQKAAAALAAEEPRHG